MGSFFNSYYYYYYRSFSIFFFPLFFLCVRACVCVFTGQTLLLLLSLSLSLSLSVASMDPFLLFVFIYLNSLYQSLFTLIRCGYLPASTFLLLPSPAFLFHFLALPLLFFCPAHAHIHQTVCSFFFFFSLMM